MKKIFILMLCCFSLILANAQKANVVLSSNSICAGQTVTADVTIDTMNLQTIFGGSNQQNGIMFDITGTNPAIIKGFCIDLATGPADFEVYYKVGTHVGFENNSSAWTLLGSSTGIVAGGNVDIGVSFNLPIANCQTLAFYVTINSTTYYIGYTNGTSIGNTIAYDNYLTIREGTGLSYPFGSTFSPRVFNGTVIFEPEVAYINWSDGSVGTTLTDQPLKSISYKADVTFVDSVKSSPHAELLVQDAELALTASPPTIQPGQTSLLSSDLTAKNAIFSLFDEGNYHNGAMFDLIAKENIVIKGFDFTILKNSPTCDVEIFYKTGTYIGHETNSSAWTSLGTSTVNPGYCIDPQIPISIPMAVGQKMGFYITCTSSLNHSVLYSNVPNPGSVYSGDANLDITVGSGIKYPFLSVYSGRMLNVITHYEIENPTGIQYSWSSGGSSGSVIVSPTTTTSYSLTATYNGCSFTETVTVTVSVGIDDINDENTFTVFPNPASNQLTIDLKQIYSNTTINLLDIHGKRVCDYRFFNKENIEVPLINLESGIYMLLINADGKISTRKILIEQ